ncbi:hypothetical protein HanIR_Chr17g0881031 [Helianthus annuus]|nr:hypothetical protein HanIR_Chr17g0881031 [Helianthus annuus]
MLSTNQVNKVNASKRKSTRKSTREGRRMIWRVEVRDMTALLLWIIKYILFRQNIFISSFN